ncbi:MAG: hypothetical protein M3174_02125 [Actinomycetota bacterium]|nr:hypothetical protein [Actinomycetota bacterium]
MEKIMLISNLHAGSVSAPTREVIIKALKADFKVEAVDTARRSHGIELARDAVDRDFDAVLAFGGDGTINEVAQALVDTDVALGILPGGSTNVLARSLGIPVNPVEATAFVGARLRAGTRRRINVGAAGDRFFLLCTGMGLDAEVVRRVEADPERKRENHEWAFVSNALKAGLGAYRGVDPGITMTVEGSDPVRVMTAVCCNGRPFTYLRRFPVDVCPQATLEGGFDVFGLHRLRMGTAPRLVWALFVSRSHVRWRTTTYRHDVARVHLDADRPMPVQVDGDYIGESTGHSIVLRRDALDLLV